MLEFCFLINRASNERSVALSHLCSVKPAETRTFVPAHNDRLKCEVFFSPTHPREEFEQNCRVTPNGTFELLRGYPISTDGWPIAAVADFDPDETYQGDFFFLSIDATGKTNVVKPKICSYELYYSNTESVDVLSSRPSMCAAVLESLKAGNGTSLSADFAREVCSYSVALSDASILKNVSCVLNCQTIQIENSAIYVSKPDLAFLKDDTLKRLYHTNRKLFWDDTFDKLMTATKLLELSDASIEFPLSGGKDSRLLLGLVVAAGQKDRVSTVFTNGPAHCPEVKAAGLICDRLGLPHTRRYEIENGKLLSIHKRLITHLVLSDGEVSPKDLFAVRKPERAVALLGQEMGLRNISGNADIASSESAKDWFRKHMFDGDRCKLLTAEARTANMENVYSFVDAAADAGNLFEDIPSLHRIIFRGGRWVSRIWRYTDDRLFAPFLFVQPEIILATYNSGAQSRIKEEFHFEMLRRIDPKLVEIPFAEQSWPKSLVEEKSMSPVAPLTWPSGKSLNSSIPTHIAMYQNFTKIQSFVLNDADILPSGVFDFDKIARLRRKRIRPHHYQALWQLVQITLAGKCDHLGHKVLKADARQFGFPKVDADIRKASPEKRRVIVYKLRDLGRRLRKRISSSRFL